MKKLLLVMPEDLHHQLKVYAVQQNITMRDFIVEAIADALAKKAEKSRKK